MKIDKKVISLPFWSKTIDEVLEDLRTTKEGISDKEAEERLKVFGKNVITKQRKLTKLRIFLDQFKSPLIFILVVAGVITLLMRDIGDSLFIFSAVLVNAFLGFYQENKAENALERLKSYLIERVRVIRGGKEQEIDAEYIVPGDVIYLSAGSRVPADARIISEKDLMVDESVLTGESLPIKKQVEEVPIAADISDRKNILFGGTLVVQGICRAVVFSTGENTEFGKIAKLVADRENEPTPLQKSIRKTSWYILKVVVLLVLAIFILGILRGDSLFEMFLVSVAVAVGAIPEGLPIVLTVILAIGVERLSRKNGVVRKLVAAEVLGSTTVILTDKTGTLTKADMQISDVITAKDIFSPSIKKLLSKKEFGAKKLNEEQKKVLTLALLNVDVVIENEEDKPSEWRLIGRALEKSLVKEASKHGLLINKIKEKAEISRDLPFNSRNKFSVVRVIGKDFHPPTENKNEFHVYFGAPEILLEKSNITKEEYINSLNLVNHLAQIGQRVLGVACADVNSNKKLEERDDLRFVGIIGFHDPIREDVKEYIDKVEGYGVRVAIVTGDHKGTAIAVAKQLGWDVNENNVLDGHQMKELSDKDLESQIDKIKIFARVSPEDKVRIVKLFKKKGEIVAMTGDGVNDAPSLNAADIGIAVGSGTDVSRDVADLVLLDDKFNTIVLAIEEGKRIMSNIRKSVTYLLIDVFDEIVLIGFSLAVGIKMPLTALQILWVNLFTGAFPGVSYAFEKSIDSDKKRPDTGKIFNKEVKSLIFGTGILTSILLFSIYATMINMGLNQGHVRAFIFATFGIYSIALAFPMKSLRKNIWHYDPFDNQFLNLGALFGILMIVVAVYVPFFRKLLGSEALPVMWWLPVLGFAVLCIMLAELIKMFFIRKK